MRSNISVAYMICCTFYIYGIECQTSGRPLSEGRRLRAANIRVCNRAAHAGERRSGSPQPGPAAVEPTSDNGDYVGEANPEGYIILHYRMVAVGIKQ